MTDAPGLSREDAHRVTIAASALEAIVAHARRERPAECCGLLVGTGLSVTEAVGARNTAADRNRFTIDPKDHIDARRDARHRGVEVLGFYHSHPHSEPRPSERDRAEAGYENHLYLIVSLASEPPETRLFRLEHETMVEVPFVAVG